jgi:hypothetical protein
MSNTMHFLGLQNPNSSQDAKPDKQQRWWTCELSLCEAPSTNNPTLRGFHFLLSGHVKRVDGKLAAHEGVERRHPLIATAAIPVRRHFQVDGHGDFVCRWVTPHLEKDGEALVMLECGRA